MDNNLGDLIMNNQFIRSVFIDWNRIEDDSYLHSIPSIKHLDTLEFNTPITMFVGENGSGKSTLLEAIAVAYGFNAEGGTKNYHFSTYDSHSSLCDAIHLIRGYHIPEANYFLRAESFYNVATKEEEYSKAEGKSEFYHKKSHGEGFLHLAQHQFKENGLYLLDEPEAALSPQRQLTLLIEIVECAKRGAQFIIVTHSPILLGIPDATILSFDDGYIHECSYEETESYKITELFINNKDRLLKELLIDEEE